MNICELNKLKDIAIKIRKEKLPRSFWESHFKFENDLKIKHDLEKKSLELSYSKSQEILN